MIFKKHLFLCLILVAGLYACQPIHKEVPPNIIFIMSDDHASKAISAYDNSLIQTPNIDRLAEEGIRFDNCYCTNAICAPSRAVILTGKYSHMNGVLDNSRPFDGAQQTLPKILQQAGYQTSMIGKWHLKSEPTGFDQWLVLPGQGQYYHPDFIGPDGRVAIEGYVTDIITDKGIEFLKNRDIDKPFFMMLQHKAPHRNWQPAMRHLDKYDGNDFPVPGNLQDNNEGKSRASMEQEMSISTHMSMDYDLKLTEELIHKKGLAQELFFGPGMGNPRKRMTAEDYSQWDAYYKKRTEEYNQLRGDQQLIDEWKYQQYMEDYLSCIYTMDENIGRLLDYLEQSGLDENTIVIYTSDQGFFLGEHGWYDKRFMYEEAHRMPLLIYHPDGEKGVDSHLITNADFAPTMLKLAGLNVPDDMQGTSFSDIIEGEEPDEWREAVYYHYFEYPAVHAVKRHYGLRTDKYKLIHFYYDIDAWELYDLDADPYEMNNLAEDPEYTETLLGLKKKLKKLQKEYEDQDKERYLPVVPEEISHLALGKKYTLKYMPADRYTGKSGGLTDGISYPEGEAYQLRRSNMCGFQGDDLIFETDLGKPMKITSIKVGLLQNQTDWIFLPQEVEFYTSLDGEDYMLIQTSLCEDLTEDRKIMMISAEARYPGDNVRYIKVHAKNNILPDWHPGAGKPAWLFVDEVVVLN